MCSNPNYQREPVPFKFDFTAATLSDLHSDVSVRCDEIARQHRPIFGKNLLQSFSLLNDGAPLEFFATSLAEASRRHELKERAIPVAEPDRLLAFAIGNLGQSSAGPRFDISLVIGRPRQLEVCVSQIARQTSKLGQFDFLFDFTICPSVSNIHIHHVSLGQNDQHPLRGCGLISEVFERAATHWGAHYPGWSVSVIAQSPAIAHLMKSVFKATKTKLDGSRLSNDTYVLQSDRNKIYQGIIR